MKSIPKMSYQEKLECLIWVWIIVLYILFFMICHGKIVNAITINERIRADASEQRKLFITSSSTGSEADIYEEDNQHVQAWPIVVNNPPQYHTFHTDTDIDWVYFYGHEGYPYEMKADDGTLCGRSIKLSLADPNGKKIISEAGPVESYYCILSWKCPKDGYYCLKIELPSEYPSERISYKLSIETEQAILVTSALGRIINSKGEGLNGIQVNFVSSGQIIKAAETGSLHNVQNNILTQSKIDGWYFIPQIESGIYDLWITEKDSPQRVLKQCIGIVLLPHQVNRIDNILIEAMEREDTYATKGFESIYTKWQNEAGKDYPVWQDDDEDGVDNMEEFLQGTDPSSFPPPQKEYCLYPGLNLIPFTRSVIYDAAPYPAYIFFYENLKDGDVLYGYDQEMKEWNYISKIGGQWRGSDFYMINGKGYLIYKNSHQLPHQVIPQDETEVITPLSFGLNLTKISLLSKKDTSFDLLLKLKPIGAQNISHYNHEKGAWESTTLFFGKPGGINYPIQPTDAYLIMVKEGE